MSAGATRHVRPAARRFSSLALRNYRLFFIGQLVSVSGTWMQTVAQSFLVLQLTSSGTMLGLATAARFAPILLLGPWGGLLADRLDKRRLLYATQSLSAIIALLFAILVTTDAIALWMVFVLSTALGIVNVVDNPARQTFISELVSPDQLRNAVTLNSVTQNIARVLGGAFAGVTVSVLGLGECFGLNALSFVAVLVSLAMMSRAEIASVVRPPRARGQIRQGLRYVAGTRELWLPLVMVAVVGMLTWEFQISLPLVAKQTFGGGAATYGLMTVAMGAGAIVGGLATAGRPSTGGQSLAVAALGWGTSITLAALAPTLWSEYVILVFVGYGSVTFNALAKTWLQLAAVPEMRGRVMALWVLAWQGSTPIGGPIIGRISEIATARWGLLTGGIAALAVGAACYPILRGRPPRPDAAVSAADVPDTSGPSRPRFRR